MWRLALAVCAVFFPVSLSAQTRIAGDWQLSLSCNYWALWTSDTISIPSDSAGTGASARLGAVSLRRNGSELIAQGNGATWSGRISGNTWSGFWDPGGYTGGKCSFTASRSPAANEAPQPTATSRPRSAPAATDGQDNAEVCGLVLGTGTTACVGTNERCACITFKNTCPYPVQVSARLSGVKNLRGDSPQGGKTGQICATKDANQQVEYMGFKPWAGYPKRGQPRPTGK